MTDYIRSEELHQTLIFVLDQDINPRIKQCIIFGLIVDQITDHTSLKVSGIFLIDFENFIYHSLYINTTKEFIKFTGDNKECIISLRDSQIKSKLDDIFEN